MSMRILGLVNCFYSPELGPMTKHRSVASTSFLGRYAFIDFALSNFLNSKIPYIGVLCQNHIRSLSRHVGSGTPWMMNTKISSFQILYDEPFVANPGYNTDVACLLENKWYIDQAMPDYVIIAPSYVVFEEDYQNLIDEHIRSKAKVSVLFKHTKGLKNSFIGAKRLTMNQNAKVTKIQINQGDIDEGDISLSTYIMDRKTFEFILDVAKSTSSFFSFTDTLNSLSKSISIKGIEHKSYAKCFDSLDHYLKYSLDLLNRREFSSLFRNDWTIFTKTYDTPPSLYRKGSKVSNSYIANGCIIDGEVTNCIIGRGVKIKKGCVIKNAVIGSNSYIAENTHIEYAVVDKEAKVMHISEVIGTIDDPMYISRGDIV